MIPTFHPLWARWQTWLLELPRFNKRGILVGWDFLLLSVALWLPISLRYTTFYVPRDLTTALLFLSAPLIAVSTFALSGLYKLVTRYLGYRGHTRIIGCIWLSVLIWSLLVFMSGQLGIPRSVVIAYGVLATLFITASRAVAAMLLESVGIRLAELPADAERKAVIIFGAGQLGVQLLAALRRANDREPIAFIDTEPSLWRQYVAGLKVYNPDRIGPLIERHKVREILIALPEERRRERRRMLKELAIYPVELKVLPAIEDITSGRVRVSDLRPLDVNDLLGRDKVPPNGELLARKTHDKSILVTGAGGSVGSELVRQLLKHSPRRVVLLDISEAALYEIGEEARTLIGSLQGSARPELVLVLGSVLDATQVRETIAQHGIEVIYHAAAYKHVPIVEQNPICGLQNNTFGTQVLAECAKARRRRALRADLDRQGGAADQRHGREQAPRRADPAGAASRRRSRPSSPWSASATCSTVSGSVVPHFRQQIRAGGPVTVTHPEIIRYFMSIPEAAQLVIQAGAMAQGGDVFVLDMGEPVRSTISRAP